jgi:hypothetical protein
MNFKEWFELNEEKDACYHKVKARYDVWPSAYASGALVKCRKKGAKNWGNSKKKKHKKKHMQEEGVQIDEALADMRQYNDASMAVKQLRRYGYNAATMSAQEIIDALNSPEHDIEKRNKLFPSDVSPELFAARIKAVARENVVVKDFGNNDHNFEKEIENVLNLMHQKMFTTSLGNPKVLASQLKYFGWKSRFGLDNLASAVLQRIRERDQKLLRRAEIV